MGIFTKKKEVELFAPVTGRMIELSQVPDQVFASKMMGDGVAFELEEGLVCAPCDGRITTIFPTLHAFGMTLENGAELLIHIGLDTVELEGNGFKKLAEEGKKVKAGTPVIEVDLNYMKENKVVTVTPMVITNSSDYHVVIEAVSAVAGTRDRVMICEKA